MSLITTQSARESVQKMFLILGKSITSQQVELYAETLLEAATDSEIEKACVRLRSTWDQSWYPKPKHILECVNSSPSKEIEITECKKCDSTGYRFKLKDPDNIAYRCHCPIGMKLSTLIQLYDF